MNEDSATPSAASQPETASDTSKVFEALSTAAKQYREYVQLAQLAEVSAKLGSEMRSYDRTWDHPLGMVLDKR